MIARTWHGRIRSEDSEEYLEYLKRTGLADYGKVPGNRGTRALRRFDGDVADFLLITFWDSWEAIKAFAGNDVDRAVYYLEDSRFLLELEPTVTHYEVVFSE